MFAKLKSDSHFSKYCLTQRGAGGRQIYISLEESAKVRKSLKKNSLDKKKKTEWEGTKRRWREKRVGKFEPEGKRQTTKTISERGRTE